MSEHLITPALRVLTVPRTGGDPSGLLADFVGDTTAIWARHGKGLLGFGELASFSTTGPARFREASAWLRTLEAAATVDDRVGRPGTGLAAFGAFSFSKTSTVASTLRVPRVIVGADDEGAWITLASTDPAEVLDEAAAEAALASALASAAESTGEVSPALEPGRIAENAFHASVNSAVERIRAEDVQKVVLSRDAVVTTASEVPVARTLRELSARYVDCWAYGVGGLLGATPEMLIQVLDGTARARVLAGTLDRAAGQRAGDEAATASLVADAKQREEHQYAIDSFIDALGPLAEGMEAPAEPFVLQLPNVWHLASDVRARLSTREDGSLPGALELLDVVHPTAAVCGTPRERAGEIIRALEGQDRGLYAGPVGWVDARGNGEFGIALRGGVVEPGRHAVRLWAGCGIVAESDPDAELAETWAKMRPMLEALGVPLPLVHRLVH